MNEDQSYAELGRQYRFYSTVRYVAFLLAVGVVTGKWTVVGLWRVGQDLRGFAVVTGVGVLAILMMIDSAAIDHVRAAVQQGVLLEKDQPGYFNAVSKIAPGGFLSPRAARIFYFAAAAALLRAYPNNPSFVYN